MSLSSELPLIILSITASGPDTGQNISISHDKAFAAQQEIITPASPPSYANILLKQAEQNDFVRRLENLPRAPLSTSNRHNLGAQTIAATTLPYDVPLNDEHIWLHNQGVTSPSALPSSQWPAQFIVNIGPQDTALEQNQTGENDENLPPPIVVDGIEMDFVDEFSLETFELVDAVDLAVVEPVIDFYRDTVPSPLRQASQNFVRNLGEPVNFLNYLLQLKPGKAIETAGRFLINSTLGLGGLIDIAGKPGINLPYRYNGLANTLGYYGVKQGRFLYLPLIGGTTARDLIGNTIDGLLTPALYGAPVNRPIFAIPVGAVSVLNIRLDNDAEIDRIRDESADQFSATRDSYFLFRENEIRALRGLPPLTELEEEPEEREEPENSEPQDDLEKAKSE